MTCLILLAALVPCLIRPPVLASARPLPQKGGLMNTTWRRNLEYQSCSTGNPIDDCWRCNSKDRKYFARCGIGFGKYATGGYHGDIYVVTDSSDNNTDPKPGTLRHAVIQEEPLWIIFSGDMRIVLLQELMVSSHKTIDARDRKVVLTGFSGITLQFVQNVIITGLEIKNIASGGNALVCDSPTHCGWRTKSDGDGISLFGAKNIWIDHCTLHRCTDGLIDIIEGSTDVTISNCHFYDHYEVMLLGSSDSYTSDDDMRVTIAYNVFGKNLNQRMPRGRFGFANVVNNHWPCGWGIYAVGGSDDFSILSQGNIFMAPDDEQYKGVSYTQDNSLNCRSEKDDLQNGAHFNEWGNVDVEKYEPEFLLTPNDADEVEAITARAGTWWDNNNKGC